MRRISLVIVILTLVAVTASVWRTPTSIQAASVLSNGSFENGTYSPTGTPTGWSKSAYDGSAIFTWDNSTYYSGSKSVKITLNTQNDARWTQTISVQPHMNYVLSGWIKTQNVSGGAGANLGLYGTWDRSAGLYGTNNWTFVTFPFSSGSNTQITIGARLGHWSATSTGTVWFDELRVELGFVANGSFEDGSSSPTDWSTSAWDPAHAAFAWDSTTAVDGTRSVKITASATNDAYWSQPISVQPNTDYVLSGWIKTQGVSGGAGANLGLFGRWDRTPGLYGTNGWTYVTLPFNSGPDTQITPAGRIGHWGATSSGTVWFDNLRVDRPIDWKMLVLIYGTTDFSYTDASGSHRVIATMTQTEKNRAANAAGRFVQDVRLLSSGYQRPQLTVRYPSNALTQLSSFCGYWPSPSNTAADRDPAFDSVIVIWDDTGTDQITGQQVDLQGCGGLTSVSQGTGQAYSTFPVTSTSDNEENVFKHEWGHGIVAYYAAAGTAPTPSVNNHINDTTTQYRHCQSGTSYVLVDETNSNPIPNSIYNNNSGFTHDYYSGITATPDQVTRCLGITPAAWSSGGPVTKP